MGRHASPLLRVFHTCTYAPIQPIHRRAHTSSTSASALPTAPADRGPACARASVFPHSADAKKLDTAPYSKAACNGPCMVWASAPVALKNPRPRPQTSSSLPPSSLTPQWTKPCSCSHRLSASGSRPVFLRLFFLVPFPFRVPFRVPVALRPPGCQISLSLSPLPSHLPHCAPAPSAVASSFTVARLRALTPYHLQSPASPLRSLCFSWSS